jgi:hypothetical protein
VLRVSQDSSRLLFPQSSITVLAQIDIRATVALLFHLDALTFPKRAGPLAHHAFVNGRPASPPFHVAPIQTTALILDASVLVMAISLMFQSPDDDGDARQKQGKSSIYRNDHSVEQAKKFNMKNFFLYAGMVFVAVACLSLRIATW